MVAAEVSDMKEEESVSSCVSNFSGVEGSSDEAAITSIEHAMASRCRLRRSFRGS